MKPTGGAATMSGKGNDFIFRICTKSYPLVSVNLMETEIIPFSPNPTNDISILPVTLSDWMRVGEN